MRYYLTLVVFMIWFTSQAQSPNPPISIKIPDTTLEAALHLVEQQANIPMAWEYTRLKGIRVKARVYKQVPVETILKQLLEGTRLWYKQKGGNIFIIVRQETTNTLSGFIEDAVSGEKLIGASLQAPQLKVGTSTNNYGFYSLTIPGDSLYVILSYMGYQPLDTVVSLKSSTRLNFRLRAANRQMEEITVSAGRTAPIQQTSQMSRINVPVSQVRSLPRLLGEADLLKTLQLLPGVKQGSEGTSAVLVRGGTPDQNLILLDGAPLYNPTHVLGIFSTFNTSVLKDVTLFKGAFPARYGGRLSSVIDIVTKDGDMQKIHGDFSIGLLSSQMTLEGPLKKGKTSFVLSGRRSYIDLLAAPLIKGKDGAPDRFRAFIYDINAKIHHQFSDKDKLYLSLYMGKDKLAATSKDESRIDPTTNSSNRTDVGLQWGNITGTLRWNHIFSPKLFANTMLIGSRYRFNTGTSAENKFNNDVSTSSLKLTSGIEDYGVKTDIDFRPSPAHTIKMGIGYTFRTFAPGTMRMRQSSDNTESLDSANNNQIVKASETDLYVEDDWELTRNLKLNAGLHWSSFIVQKQFYHSLQPRVSMRFLLPKDWALKASYSRMTQYIHLLANNSLSLPTDLWVPATKKIQPQDADQFALGLARNLFRNKYEFSVEVYYKKMNKVIEYKDGASYISATEGDSWQEQVAAGTGESYGMEWLLQRKTGRLTGWLGYTWAIADRKIPQVNQGKAFPYKYDRRHDVHLVAIYKARKNIELSGSWTYQSAAPFTIPIANYEGIEGPIPSDGQQYYPQVAYINSRNNVRVYDYHRLDVGISFIKQKKNGTVRTWNISILNVYNRKNPFFYYVNQNAPYSPNARANITSVVLLPILPSFSYSLKF